MCPFVSRAQQRYMYAKHPEIAAEFTEKTKSFKNLPEHVSHKKTGAIKMKKEHEKKEHHKKELEAKKHMHKHHHEMAKFHAKEHAHHMKMCAKHAKKK